MLFLHYLVLHLFSHLFSLFISVLKCAIFCRWRELLLLVKLIYWHGDREKPWKITKRNVDVNPFVPNAHFLYPLKSLFLGGRERAHWEKSLQVYKIVDRNVFYVPVSISQRKNTRQRCEISSKLTIKTPGRCNRVFTVNFEHISHLCLLYLSR